jgi:flavin-binding protein dodecin
MAIVKVIEVIAQSETSFDDAVKVACAEATKSLRGVQSIYVQDMQAIVENDQIVRYRVNTKVSFVVGEEAGNGDENG